MPATEARKNQAKTPQIALLPLLIAIAITVALTVYPLVLARAGKPDHMVAMLAFWAMSAGYVRGVGFVPRHPLLKMAFSTYACLGTLVAAIILSRPWG